MLVLLQPILELMVQVILLVLKGTSQINGKKIEWIRDADNATNGTTGAWRCKTDVAENLRPKSCGAS